MKVEKKESSPCVLALTVTAEAAEIKEEYQKVLTAFIRNAVVPGFRKGKIPLPILKQKFETEISQESQQECFRKLYPEALKEAAVEPLALQDVTDLSFSPERRSRRSSRCLPSSTCPSTRSSRSRRAMCR